MALFSLVCFLHTEDCAHPELYDDNATGGTIKFVVNGKGGFTAFQLEKICLVDLDGTPGSAVGVDIDGKEYTLALTPAGNGVTVCFFFPSPDAYLKELRVNLAESGAIKSLDIFPFHCF
jgi:hypothetical protein